MCSSVDGTDGDMLWNGSEGDGTDGDMLWNGSEGDGNVRSDSEKKLKQND